MDPPARASLDRWHQRDVRHRRAENLRTRRHHQPSHKAGAPPRRARLLDRRRLLGTGVRHRGEPTYDRFWIRRPRTPSHRGPPFSPQSRLRPGDGENRHEAGRGRPGPRHQMGSIRESGYLLHPRARVASRSGYSSSGVTLTAAEPSRLYWTLTVHGWQHTSQSSTYSCDGPPPGSIDISTVSLQYGQYTAASVSAVPSPSGKSASSGSSWLGRSILKNVTPGSRIPLIFVH